MGIARNLAALLDSSGDVVAGALDNAGGGGAWEVISSQTVTTAVSSVELTGLDSTYGKHVVHFSGGTATDDIMYIKYGSATSYATSATDYRATQHYYGSQHGELDQASTTCHKLHAISGVYINFELTLHGIGTTGRVYVDGTTQSDRAAQLLYGGEVHGSYANTPALAIDRLTLYTEGGANISSGTIITVYGIKTS